MSNTSKPTAKELLRELLSELVAKCGFLLIYLFAIGILGTLVGFVLWAGFWALFLLLPLFAMIYHLIKKHQSQP